MNSGEWILLEPKQLLIRLIFYSRKKIAFLQVLTSDEKWIKTINYERKGNRLDSRKKLQKSRSQIRIRSTGLCYDESERSYLLRAIGRKAALGSKHQVRIKS